MPETIWVIIGLLTIVNGILWYKLTSQVNKVLTLQTLHYDELTKLVTNVKNDLYTDLEEDYIAIKAERDTLKTNLSHLENTILKKILE